MGRVLIALLIVLHASPVFAATFSVTTTPEQDNALVLLRRKVNTERAAMSPPAPALTAAQFLNYLTSQWLDGLATQGKTQDTMTMREAWDRADTTTKDQVKTLLGVQ